jgi:DNA-binding NtrC family response regulator
LQVLKRIKEKFPEVPVIFLSGQEKAEIAANTMKYGAWDYVVKNESAFHRIEILVNNILGHVELKKNLGTQKFFNRLLAFIVIALIVGLIITRIR